MQTTIERLPMAGNVLRSGGSSWPATLSSAFVELEFQQLETSERPIRGSIYQYPFGDLTFQRSITHGHAHRVTRTERLIRSSAHDNFFVGLLLSGGAVFSQDGRTADLSPGDIALLDSTRVYTVEVPQSFDALWIRTPRHRLEARLHNTSQIMASKIDGRSGIGCVASEMLRASLEEAPRLSAEEANRVANTLLDLLGIAFTPRWRRSDARPTAHSNTMLRRVQNFVETRLDDESLTPAEVARVNRVSIRYVNKLFEREGYTLPRWIRMRRLERCRLELEDRVTPARRIADIAYAHGFKNVSHFNRVFRARFGCSPRGFRQRK
jgi:AraC family transcriptional activator of tynA and feaB